MFGTHVTKSVEKLFLGKELLWNTAAHWTTSGWDPLEAAAMTTSSSSSYKILKPMKSMEDQAKNDDQHGQWWKEVPDGPQGQQGEEQERQVGCRLVFQNYSFDFKQAVLEKNAVQNSSMEWWKMQTFTQRKVEKQGKCRMYRNVSECIGQKTELYMYNSKKWSYTCITRKKRSYTCIARKNGIIHV